MKTVRTAAVSAVLVFMLGHAYATVIPFVQWGSSYNMLRRATSDIDSTPTSGTITLQAKQDNLDLGLGAAGSDDSRAYTSLAGSANPYLAGLIDPLGPDLSTRQFYFVSESIRVDSTSSTTSNNRRIGPTSSYSTSNDWRGPGAEQYHQYLWSADDFLSGATPSLADSSSKLEVRIRTLSNPGPDGAVRFVIQNGTQWYYSQTNATSGLLTLTDPGAAQWAPFSPGDLVSTPRALAMPAGATFSTVVFNDIQYVGFAVQTNLGTNSESRQGFDNFVFEAGTVVIPEPSMLALLTLGGSLLLRRRSSR